MPRLCLLVTVQQETLDTYESLAKMKECRLNKLLGEVLDEYVEMGLAQADMEGEIEAQTGVLLNHMTGLPEGPQLLS